MYLEFTRACIILSNVALDHIMLRCGAAEVQADPTQSWSIQMDMVQVDKSYPSFCCVCVKHGQEAERRETAKHSKDSKTDLSR